MSFSIKAKDKYNQEILPGDLCIYKGEFLIYVKRSYGSKLIGKGEYGQFIAGDKRRSIKFRNVVFMFDPMGKRRNSSKIITELCRKFYESK